MEIFLGIILGFLMLIVFITMMEAETIIQRFVGILCFIACMVIMVILSDTFEKEAKIQGIELGVKGDYDVEYTILNGDTIKVTYKIK